MRVRLSPDSIYQLTDIRDHIARERPEVAELVRLRILATVERLEEVPRLGHVSRNCLAIKTYLISISMCLKSFR